MAKSDFVPTRDGDLDKFEENFVNKLQLHSGTLGMDPGLVAELELGINSHRQAFSKMISKRAESKSATEENVLKKESAKNDLRRGARIIKSLKNYTPVIGDDLQIIGPEVIVLDPAQLQPVLIAKVNGQLITINYRKSDTDGIKLFSKRGNETEFSELGFTASTSYVDNRQKLESGKPETREYCAMYFIGAFEVGILSDKISVTIL